jgi:hypothetical protein
MTVLFIAFAAVFVIYLVRAIREWREEGIPPGQAALDSGADGGAIDPGSHGDSHHCDHGHDGFDGGHGGFDGGGHH